MKQKGIFSDRFTNIHETWVEVLRISSKNTTKYKNKRLYPLAKKLKLILPLDCHPPPSLFKKFRSNLK